MQERRWKFLRKRIRMSCVTDSNWMVYGTCSGKLSFVKCDKNKRTIWAINRLHGIFHLWCKPNTICLGLWWIVINTNSTQSCRRFLYLFHCIYCTLLLCRRCPSTIFVMLQHTHKGGLTVLVLWRIFQMFTN